MIRIEVNHARAGDVAVPVWLVCTVRALEHKDMKSWLWRSAEKRSDYLAQYGVVVDRIAVGSITDESAVRDALRCDAVVHAAAVNAHVKVASEK